MLALGTAAPAAATPAEIRPQPAVTAVPRSPLACGVEMAAASAGASSPLAEAYDIAARPFAALGGIGHGPVDSSGVALKRVMAGQ